MSEALPPTALTEARRPVALTFIRQSLPPQRDAALASLSAILVVLAFPNFEFWWLAWIGLAPLLFAVATTSRKRVAFVLGLIWGTIFFYGTCWWLTYPMIHYGGVSAWLAYPLLLLPVVFVSVFPALACVCLLLVIKRFGTLAIFAAPVMWVAFDWLRGVVTGLDWNALGYSQAFHLLTIQPARWGGVYAVGFLVLFSNAAVTFAILGQRKSKVFISVAVLAAIGGYLLYSRLQITNRDFVARAVAVSVQPNVPMDLGGDVVQMNALLDRHLLLSKAELDKQETKPPFYPLTRLVIWPESPMNFSYSRDPHLQKTIANFAQTNHASVLLNSLEPAPNGGSYNSAILVNEQGQKVAQYDKIRLMPFGEYVPLPRWLPGSGSVRGIVGEFTPGSSYTLMPLGALRAGVFICIEAAHSEVARSFTNEGADVLINISNDGYLGPTAVMRQHLSNAVFRAVENDRDLIRVTNSGISAYISANGAVSDTTPAFQEAVRSWTISKFGSGSTFYSRHGDVFAYGCALISLGFISATFMTRSQYRER
ncbi:MAG TPA: apolipoprotein N-acyltransferase [Pyrinomonadaceae bacterium]|nr:apolipoprotein N-acyltransferase [Pyrinomonadaceae bacterium]